MVQSSHIKYGTLSGILVLCTFMITATEDTHRSVFAQITPAPEKFSDNGNSDTSSSPVANDPITPSPNPNNNADDQVTTSTDQQDDSMSESVDSTSEE